MKHLKKEKKKQKKEEKKDKEKEKERLIGSEASSVMPSPAETKTAEIRGQRKENFKLLLRMPQATPELKDHISNMRQEALNSRPFFKR